VTVAAAEAWWAEVLAKAALVAGPRDGAELMREAGASGWIGTDDGQVIEVGGPGCSL
jgi:thiamine biosynthesis lipoprotein